jgi:hypothetical protein
MPCGGIFKRIFRPAGGVVYFSYFFLKGVFDPGHTFLVLPL